MADELQCIFSLLSKDVVEDVLRMFNGNGKTYTSDTLRPEGNYIRFTIACSVP